MGESFFSLRQLNKISKKFHKIHETNNITKQKKKVQPLPKIDRKSGKKNQYTGNLSNTSEQLDLTLTELFIQLKHSLFFYFSKVQGMFNMTDLILAPKVSINRFKDIQAIQSMLFYHKNIKLFKNTEIFLKNEEILGKVHTSK